MLSSTSLKRVSVIVLSIIFLLLSFIWVLPQTIALRNILLVLGFIFSLCYLTSIKYKPQFNKTTIPLLTIFSLFIWVVLHFSFFSLNPSLELKEIKSLWLRAGAGVVIAIALALIIKDGRWARISFLVALTFTPFINLAVYIYQSYVSGEILMPNKFVSNFLFNKIEAAFFGTIAISIFLAYSFHYLNQKQTLKNLMLTIVLYSACALFTISSLVSASKNGVAISLSIFMLFILCLIKNGIFKSAGRLKYLTYAIIFFGALVTFAKLHQSSASSGWENIFADIEIAVEINNFQNWKGLGAQLPLNKYGETVTVNTYERTAWATVGWSLIKQEPLGYGSINHSFKGMLNHQNISHNVPGQTHSGWTDFGLAFGLPGLAIVIFAQLNIIYIGLKNKERYSVVGSWICIALLPLGLIAEICYKQYFEATLFFIAFAAAMVYQRVPNKANEGFFLKNKRKFF